MVEHQQGPELLRSELEPHHGLVLAAEAPLVLEHVRLVPRADSALGDSVVEPEPHPSADARIHLRLREPASEPPRICERRPQLRGSEVVETLETDGAAPVVVSQNAEVGGGSGHDCSFRARRSSVSSASRRWVHKER